MNFEVQVKQAGRKANSIITTDLCLTHSPSTVEELLVLVTRETIIDFKERKESLKSGKDVDQATAIKTTIEAFEDGLIALFIDGIRYEDIKQELSLKGGETFTFVKLTMLAGRMW